MIYIYDEVKEFVTGIFKKISILRYSQLREMLIAKFNISEDEAKKYVIKLQKEGYLLVEKSGLCLTKQLYLQWSHDKFLDNIAKNNEFVRVADEFYVYGEPVGDDGIAKYQPIGVTSCKKELAKDSYRNNIVNAMWVIASYLPKSENFVTGQVPFEVNFVLESDSDNDSFLFQIMNTTEKNILSRASFVEQNCKIKDKKYMDHVFRIAIVEKPEQAILIPKIGFGLIVYIDHNADGSIYSDPNTGAFFKIAERRETFEERWEACL